MRKEPIPRYTLLWTDDEDSRKAHAVDTNTWIGRPGGFSIKDIDPYMVVLVSEDGNITKSKIYDPTVSRRHALVKPVQKGLEIIDYGRDGRGSSNGTFINEKRITPGIPVLASPGDSIRLGLYTVFRVGVREKDKVVQLVRPGDLVIVDNEKASSLPQDILRNSVRMDNGKYLVYIPVHGAVGLSRFDAGRNLRVRVEKSSGEDTDIQKRIIQNILLYLKDVMLDLNKDPPKGTEAASKISALLKVKEYRRIIEEVIGEDTVRDIDLLVDIISKGRGSSPQIKRLIVEIGTLEKALDLKYRAL